MAKTVAPLLSFDAGGQIAKAQVYATWRGIRYARRYVVPANPNTTAQQATRDPFKWLNGVWKYAPGVVTEAWDAYANGQPFTGRNGLIKINLPLLRGETDDDLLVFSPGAKSGLALAGISLTAGDGQIGVAVTLPSLPTGWTVVQSAAVAIEEQDPNSGTAYDQYSDTADSTDWSLTITGLTNTTTYVVGAWLKFTKPDGTYAYGRSISDTATPSA